MITNLYSELGIDKSWSLQEIQIYLKRKVPVWEQTYYQRQDKESEKKVKLGKEALKIFATEQRRAKYDKKLYEMTHPKKAVDPREQKCKEYTEKTRKYLQNNQLDLAEKTIQVALNSRDESNREVLKLAATIYLKKGQTQEALSYINDAIILDTSDKECYFEKLDILSQDFIYENNQPFKDETKLAKKRNQLTTYLFKDFIHHINPQTDRQYLVVYDKLFQIFKLPFCDVTLLSTINTNCQTLYADYRKRAIRLGESKFLQQAVHIDGAPGHDILAYKGAYDFSKQALRKNSNNTYLRNYVERYDRALKNKIKAQEDGIQNLEKEVRELGKKRQALVIKVRKLEDEKAIADKELAEFYESEKEISDKIDAISQRIGNSFISDMGCMGSVFAIIVISIGISIVLSIIVLGMRTEYVDLGSVFMSIFKVVVGLFILREARIYWKNHKVSNLMKSRRGWKEEERLKGACKQHFQKIYAVNQEIAALDLTINEKQQNIVRLKGKLARGVF